MLQKYNNICLFLVSFLKLNYQNVGLENILTNYHTHTNTRVRKRKEEEREKKEFKYLKSRHLHSTI